VLQEKKEKNCIWQLVRVGTEQRIPRANLMKCHDLPRSQLHKR